MEVHLWNCGNQEKKENMDNLKCMNDSAFDIVFFYL